MAFVDHSSAQSEYENVETVTSGTTGTTPNYPTATAPQTVEIEASKPEPSGSTNTMASARAVLETWELLENIMVHVSPYSMLNLERVSKYWNQLMRESKRIQRARCLNPSACNPYRNLHYFWMPHSNSSSTERDSLPLHRTGHSH